MAWGPDGRLYASRIAGGAVSFAYDAATGGFSRLAAGLEHQRGGASGSCPAGARCIETSLGRLDLAANPERVHAPPLGGAGSPKVAIVRGIPTGDHNVDQIQIGQHPLRRHRHRTINGGTARNRALVFRRPRRPGDGPGGPGNDRRRVGLRRHDLDDQGADSKVASVPTPRACSARQRGYHPERRLTVTRRRRQAGRLARPGTRNPFGLAVDRDGALHSQQRLQPRHLQRRRHGRGRGFDAPGGDLKHQRPRPVLQGGRGGRLRLSGTTTGAGSRRS